MNGHSTQFGPHEEARRMPIPKKKYDGIRYQSREHILILLALLFFSVNVALAFTSNIGRSPIVDEILLSGQSASILDFLRF